MCNAALTHVEIPWPRDAIKLKMTAWLSWATSTTKQKWIYQFFWKRFNQDDSSSPILVAWFSVSCFFLLKSFFEVRLFCKRHFWRHLHVTMLKCWAKFSDDTLKYQDDLCQTLRNCVYKFVKIMPRKLVASFFPDTSMHWTDSMFVWTCILLHRCKDSVRDNVVSDVVTITSSLRHNIN